MRPRPLVALEPQELEILRWAVAGKTPQVIAAITGPSYRTVRDRLDRRLNRYGCATLQQTMARAAFGYDLDTSGG